MSFQSITIHLPEEIYRQLEQQSKQMQRSLTEEVTIAVTTSTQQNQLSPSLQAELDQLDFFTEEELWRAARLTAPEEKSERMQALVEKQSLEGLTPAEKEESQLLSDYFNQIMLVRAKSAVLLKELGHDISILVDDE
ncbi:MAG TPA: hypothetical protein VLL52_19110 [Anaerolineae bacterium]|nr:hypothetical protein [Anaerolineae bacterium]